MSKNLWGDLQATDIGGIDKVELEGGGGVALGGAHINTDWAYQYAGRPPRVWPGLHWPISPHHCTACQ